MPYPNLIYDKELLDDVIQLLQASGGEADVVTVLDVVMRMRSAPPELARKLVAELVGKDPRFELIESSLKLIDDGRTNPNLDDATFVVFDLETTGAKAPPCRITEIGAFKIEAGRITDKFHTLVNPETPIPEFITGLTGISDKMVADAPKFSEILGDLLGFLGDSVLVAHNAQFDMRFLNYEIGLVHEDHKIANGHLCTVQLSRKLVPHIENHRLNTVANHFRIPLVNHHRASDDAYATAEIFINLLGALKERGVEDVESARRLRMH